MDSFENKIIDGIQKIRDLKQRSHANRIFKTITKDAAMNASSADIQRQIDQMIASSQLKNKLFQGMNYFYNISEGMPENNITGNKVLELFEE